MDINKEILPVIYAKNVTKIFPLHPQAMRARGANIFSYFRRNVLKATDNQFPALKDINLEIFQGEAVGIVGSNGAGKSTLLQILTGISKPTSGLVSIRGEHGALFSLNSGFNLDLSGRKNIYLHAAIKGIPKVEIENKIDEIIEFSELGSFIDQPVKNYSSGMRGRLGFSIVIHTMPDTIFIDEALATGDVKFREKCQEKLDEFIHGNRTMVLVSHNSKNILDICSRAIWLEKGEIQMDSRPEEVVNAYQIFKKVKRDDDEN